MSLKLALAGGNQIKQFKAALQSLGKLGTSHELLLEALPERLILRTINSSRSAYMSVTFHCSFFDDYNVYGAAVVQAGLLTKHALSVLRTQRVARLLLELEPETNVAGFTLLCDNGLRKTYSVGLLDSEILQASVDRGSFPISAVAEAVALSRLLSSFPPNLEEVTIVAMPEDDVGGNNGGGAGAGGQLGKAVQLHSFVDRSKLKGETLTTQLALDTHEVFLRYSHNALEPADVTFNLRDFRIMVSLAEGLRANVQLHLHRPGAPLLVEPSHRGPGFPPLPYEAELVLATLLESQLDRLRQQPINQPRGGGGGGGRVAARAAEQQQQQQQRENGGGGLPPVSGPAERYNGPAAMEAEPRTPAAAAAVGAWPEHAGASDGGAWQQQQQMARGGAGGDDWAAAGPPSGLMDDAGAGSWQQQQQLLLQQGSDDHGEMLPAGGGGGDDDWPAAAAAGPGGGSGGGGGGPVGGGGGNEDEEEEIPPSPPPDKRRRSGGFFAPGMLPTGPPLDDDDDDDMGF